MVTTMPAFANIASVGSASAEVSLWLSLPFGLLLLLIATMPLSPPRVKHFWDKYYSLVAVGLGALVAVVYLTKISGGGDAVVATIKDYFSFIALIGSLFVVAGGIHLKVKGEATPQENIVFLILGAVVANVIGTTGASMVLIRPWIRMNKIRASPYHVVFFIFIVSNVGGALTPIGDPPLFLGYLRGVPFFWLVDHIIWLWLVTLAAILGVFWAFDARSFARMPRQLQHEAGLTDMWRFDGLINVPLLLVIIGAVFLPEKFFLREAMMLGAAGASYWLTPKAVHAENHFSFEPIKEVAWLFAGIFPTMLPALGYLAAHGHEFDINGPLNYYFASGALSAVLDNAPAYASFFQLAKTTAGAADTGALLKSHPLYVIGVSLGTVFFGAMTYIGNGPNFIVKSIAHDAGVHGPTFFGYIFKYSLPILLPILALTGWLLLR